MCFKFKEGTDGRGVPWSKRPTPTAKSRRWSLIKTADSNFDRGVSDWQSWLPAELFFVRFRWRCLPLEENLDAICGPDCDTGPKEIGILRPDAASESESTSQYGPVSFIATAQAQSSFAFKDGINIRTNRLDEFSQIPSAPDKSSDLPRFLRSGGKLFLGVSEGYVRCEEIGALCGVGVNEFPDTPPPVRHECSTRVASNFALPIA